mgnify:CR=1 FL=1
MLERLADIERRYEELSDLINDPEIIADNERWRKLMKEHSDITPIVEKYREYKKIKEELAEAEEMLNDSSIDDDFKALVKEEFSENKKKIVDTEEELKILMLPKDPNDDKNVIVEIRGGAGGDEANIFAGDLYRMYSRYAERRRWKTEIMSVNESEAGGFREISFMISGQGAYSRLKYESGVHRAQRIPATESSGRIHTSTATVAMLPVVEELYDKKEDQARSMKTYTAFFNTEPQLGTVIVGMTAGLEEARANGTEDVDDETINGLRAGLMGPIAGIGDSLVVGTVIPILLGIALGMSTGGSPLGAIMYIIVWNLFAYFGMKFLYFKGYELGGKAVDFLVGPQGEALRESVTMLGGIVIGAVSATWISVTTSFTMTAAGAKKPFLDLQKTLDGVYPGLLTAVFVVGCWYLLSKKKMSPIKVMLLLVVVAFIGVFVGFFNPGLSY